MSDSPRPDPDKKFVGIQVSPISFIDEGVDNVLDTLQDRVGVNALLIGTVSWLGLKSGRSISWELDGWPDHGVPEPFSMQGGAYIEPHAEYYRNTFIDDFRAKDPEMAGKDVLEMVIPAARERGMIVYAELMEPFFKYAGHGSAEAVPIPNLPQALEVDFLGRFGSEPSTSHPDYRTWIQSMIEDHVRSYDLDGLMWCNERRSPIDQLVAGMAPGDFSDAACEDAERRGVDVERTRRAFHEVYDYFQAARDGEEFVDGAFIEGLRVLMANPEVFLWEKVWVERNKDLDRELYGIAKWCDPNLQFGLNVWNRNHFNPLRKAQWPWKEQTRWSDWVKPITYQHQSGQIYHKEMADLHRSLLRDLDPAAVTPLMYALLGLDEAPWDQLIQTGMDPDTYVYGQCRDTVRAVEGRVPVYMGIGVDAPRVQEDQAVCTPDIVYRSVHATYRAGGEGVIFSPNYASMKLTNLDGAAKALEELGLK
jgi:hypothetical protein